MLPPHPCLLLPQLDPIALCCPGNRLSKKKFKLSKAPRFSALPACLSVGRKEESKGQTEFALGSLAPSPSRSPRAYPHLLTVANYTTIFPTVHSMIECRGPVQPRPLQGPHTGLLPCGGLRTAKIGIPKSQPLQPPWFGVSLWGSDFQPWLFELLGHLFKNTINLGTISVFLRSAPGFQCAVGASTTAVQGGP